MNSRPLRNERNRVHGREGESETDPQPHPQMGDGSKKNPERGDRTPQYRDTRAEMERGREGKNGGKGHWTMIFRDGY